MLKNMSKKRVVKYLKEFEFNTNITYMYQISFTLFIYLMITQIILKQIQITDFPLKRYIFFKRG